MRRFHTDRGRFLRQLALSLACALLLPVAASAEDDRPTELPYDTPNGLPSLDPSYRRNAHTVVVIKDGDLLPKTATVEEGELVAWISYAHAPSTIVFEREVARSMICHSLVNFSIQEDELRSAEIHPGEFASFCQLKPGKYRYKVVRRNTHATGQLGSASQLDGWIVVEGGSDEADG